MATPIKVNRIGLEPQIYKGGKTTLCAGCGHNAISERIIDAFYEMGVDPGQVVKLSGIGCSSKSPAYFLGSSHGFNAVHGRMPSVGTGAMLANKKLIAIGVSGDGDTGAIGIGQFVHLMRRNLPIMNHVHVGLCCTEKDVLFGVAQAFLRGANACLGGSHIVLGLEAIEQHLVDLHTVAAGGQARRAGIAARIGVVDACRRPHRWPPSGLGDGHVLVNDANAGASRIQLRIVLVSLRQSAGDGLG